MLPTKAILYESYLTKRVLNKASVPYSVDAGA